jgi:primosomal protein N' (replication factor Y)
MNKDHLNTNGDNSMHGAAPILAVAVPSPLRRLFDYLAPIEGSVPQPGMRVQVPFGSRQRIGMVIKHRQSSAINPEKLKPISACLDSEPVFDGALLQLMEFTVRYTHHPPGEVMACMLPPALRKGASLLPATIRCWQLTESGRAQNSGEMLRGVRQREVVEQLREMARPQPREKIQADISVLKRLQQKGLIEAVDVIAEPNINLPDNEDPSADQNSTSAHQLNEQQVHAVNAVRDSFDRFQGFLLDGVTGSGKTEVYLELIAERVKENYQALVLVPEIGLTPQLVARFQARLGTSISVIHSGLNQTQRIEAWQAAQSKTASVVIGTRSAVFSPLPNLGLVVVDEEHDLSFKQHDGVRYSARDLAVVRAAHAQVPIVLGSATPSLESLHNITRNGYQRLVLDQRAGESRPPRVEVIDLRGRRLNDGLSQPLEEALEQCIAERGQALLFINRRGYAPVMLCHDCGTPFDCPRCDAHMVLHRTDGRLHCHHCQRVQSLPNQCACGQENSYVAVGAGTQRVTEYLQQRIPGVRIARVDRDSTRRRGAMQEVLESIHSGQVDILVGTQMLAKGHHFPNVTLVGILDADGGIFSADFRAAERMAQLLIQVSGRAGRSTRSGRVILQTHHPDHPLLRTLITQGYSCFAESALEERQVVGLPPFSFQALIRAEAQQPNIAQQFLHQAKDVCPQNSQLRLYGPVAAPLERRAGWVRAQLLLESPERARLHECLRNWLPKIEALKAARRVRWSLDVDPLDML